MLGRIRRIENPAEFVPVIDRGDVLRGNRSPEYVTRVGLIRPTLGSSEEAFHTRTISPYEIVLAREGPRNIVRPLPFDRRDWAFFWRPESESLRTGIVQSEISVNNVNHFLTVFYRV